MGFKCLVYDRMTPITLVSKMIEQRQFSRVLLGEMFMICYFNSPPAGQWSYCLSSVSGIGPGKVMEIVEKTNNGTEAGTLFPNEIDLMNVVSLGATLYGSYWLYQ